MHHTGFRTVLAADMVSTFGSLMSRLAIPWLAVLVLGAGPAAMAWLAVADVAAGAVAALFAGTLVDRYSKRATMICCDLLRAGALVLVAVLAACDRLSMPVLWAVVGLNGALTVAFELAQSAWIARHTPDDALATRNAQMAAGAAATEAASFGITGWVFQWIGGVASMLADAATYLVSALLLLRVKELPADAQAPAPRLGWWQDMRRSARAFREETASGFRQIAARPALRALAWITMLVALATSFAMTSYMIYVSRDLGFGTGLLGMVFAAGAFGSLAGSWIAARMAERAGSGRLIFAGLMVWAAGSACAPLAVGAGLLALALLLTQQIIGDAGASVFQIHDRTLRQREAPAGYLARVDSGLRALGHGCTLAGAIAGGFAAELLGARALLFASSAAIAAAAVAAWWTLVRRRREGVA